MNRLLSRIAESSEQNATLVGNRIERAAAHLAESPTGHFGRVQNTYEVVVLKTPYIIAYAKSGEAITILRIIHGARDWRKGAWPDADSPGA